MTSFNVLSSFPQSDDIPSFLAQSHVFDAIAITFADGYPNECWEEIWKRIISKSPVGPLKVCYTPHDCS